jgi:hypothetical protein
LEPGIGRRSRFKAVDIRPCKVYRPNRTKMFHVKLFGTIQTAGNAPRLVGLRASGQVQTAPTIGVFPEPTPPVPPPPPPRLKRSLASGLPPFQPATARVLPSLLRGITVEYLSYPSRGNSRQVFIASSSAQKASRNPHGPRGARTRFANRRKSCKRKAPLRFHTTALRLGNRRNAFLSDHCVVLMRRAFPPTAAVLIETVCSRQKRLR